MTNRQEIEVAEGVTVQIKVDGDLQVHGQEGALMRAEGSNETPSIQQADGTVQVECRGDCVVYLPLWAAVEIETQGDLLVDGMHSGVTVVFCGGDAAVAGAGKVDIKEVGGDLQASQIDSMEAREIHGDAHLSDVRGPVSVGAKGDVHIHQVAGSVSANAKGNVRLAEVTGEKIQVNAKGDTHLLRCQADISVNTAGDVHLNEIVSQQVRAVAKGDVRVHFSEKVGGQAKIVTSGDLFVRSQGKSMRKGRGVYTFRFGEGDAVFSFISKGDTLLEGLDLADGSLHGISADMGKIGDELGAELGAMGAEMGREFSDLGRDIARQVQDKVARKMKDLGKRTAKVEWGEGKSWSFNFGDVPVPPKSPTPPQRPMPPARPGWDAPFNAIEETVPGEPVSEEERTLVLRMLEDGKISAAEAATLLEALGDAE